MFLGRDSVCRFMGARADQRRDSDQSQQHGRRHGNWNSRPRGDPAENAPQRIHPAERRRMPWVSSGPPAGCGFVSTIGDGRSAERFLGARLGYGSFDGLGGRGTKQIGRGAEPHFLRRLRRGRRPFPDGAPAAVRSLRVSLMSSSAWLQSGRIGASSAWPKILLTSPSTSSAFSPASIRGGRGSAPDSAFAGCGG